MINVVMCPHCGSYEVSCNYTESKFEECLHVDLCTCHMCGRRFKIEYRATAIHEEDWSFEN